MYFCCWCGKDHKEESECWLNSKEAKLKMWNKIINTIVKNLINKQ